ncbi:mechanosensitive ion channel family protein [candidate division KSB1 bacterium]
MGNIGKTLLEQIILFGPKVVISVVILLIFWIFANVANRAIIKIFKQTELNANIASLLARTAKIALIIFGFVTALGTLGVNVSAIVAGLGLTGFALGFALKDTISNLLSGVLILVYRPFGIGNHIKISGYEGTVVSIDLRYTELEGEGNKILIPNSKLFTDPITVLR